MFSYSNDSWNDSFWTNYTRSDDDSYADDFVCYGPDDYDGGETYKDAKIKVLCISPEGY